MVPSLPALTLYGRAGCHLCDDARAMLDSIAEERAAAGLGTPAVVEVDIDTDRVSHDAFFETIPVVEVGDRRLELVTSRGKLRRFLAEVLDDRQTTVRASVSEVTG